MENIAQFKYLYIPFLLWFFIQLFKVIWDLVTLLNKIINTPGLTNLQVQEKLVEVLGHTPKQVIVGALIGIIAGLIL